MNPTLGLCDTFHRNKLEINSTEIIAVYADPNDAQDRYLHRLCGIPYSQGRMTIIVVVDRLSKFTHFPLVKILSLHLRLNKFSSWRLKAIIQAICIREWIFLKLYRQVLVRGWTIQIHTLHSCQVLVKGELPHMLPARSRYYVLFQVSTRMGKVAYKLHLPLGARSMTCFTFHAVRHARSIQIFLWELKEREHENELERRMVRKGNNAESQVLIQENGTGEGEPTQEDFAVFEQKFHKFIVEALIVLFEGGLFKDPFG